MRPAAFPGVQAEAHFAELLRWFAGAAVIAIVFGLLGLYPLAFAGLVVYACLVACRSTRAACVAVALLSPIMAVGSLDVGFNMIPLYPVVLVGLLGALWRREYRAVRVRPPDVALGLFALMAVLITVATFGTAPEGGVLGATGVNGPTLRPVAQLGLLMTMFGVYALFRMGAQEPAVYRSSLRALAASFCVVAAYGAYQVVARLGDLPYAYVNDRRETVDLPQGQTYIRISSTLTEASPLAAFTICILLLSMAALLAGRGKGATWRERRRPLLLSLAAVAIIVATMSKAAMLAVLLAAPLLLTARAIHVRLRTVIPVGVGFALLILGVVALRYPDFLTSPGLAFDSERFVRVGYWLAAVDMSAAHPFGVGTGNFAFFYPDYAEITPSYEYYSRITDAHSWFLEAFAETGILGGSAFLAFVLTLVVSGLRTGRSTVADWGPSLTALTVAFVVFSLMHLTYSVFYYPYEWVVAGLIVARVAAGAQVTEASVDSTARLRTSAE